MIAADPTRDHFLSGAKQKVSLYDADKKHPLDTMSFDGKVLTIAIAPNGKGFVVGTDAPSLWTCTLGDKEVGPCLSLDPHGRNIDNAAFSPDSSIFATASKVGVMVWDVEGYLQPHATSGDEREPGVRDVHAGDGGSERGRGGERGGRPDGGRGIQRWSRRALEAAGEVRGGVVDLRRAAVGCLRVRGCARRLPR